MFPHPHGSVSLFAATQHGDAMGKGGVGPPACSMSDCMLHPGENLLSSHSLHQIRIKVVQ